MKLNNTYFIFDCRNYFFTNKCIDVWNIKITVNEVSITSLNSFKKAIDKISFRSYCRGRGFDV